MSERVEFDPEDPGNAPGVLALAAAISASWPYPPITLLDRRELRRQLSRNGVSPEQAIDALDDLVAAGREYQPRAPHLIAAVRARRAHVEGQTPDYDRPAIAAHASTSPDQLADEADEITDPRLAALIGRVARAKKAPLAGRRRAGGSGADHLEGR